MDLRRILQFQLSSKNRCLGELCSSNRTPSYVHHQKDCASQVLRCMGYVFTRTHEMSSAEQAKAESLWGRSTDHGGSRKLLGLSRSTAGVGRLIPDGAHSRSPPFPPPPSSLPPMLLMSTISGRNKAMTMLPTTTARNTIMIGSRSEVMAETALSTSSS